MRVAGRCFKRRTCAAHHHLQTTRLSSQLSISDLAGRRRLSRRSRTARAHKRAVIGSASRNARPHRKRLNTRHQRRMLLRGRPVRWQRRRWRWGAADARQCLHPRRDRDLVRARDSGNHRPVVRCIRSCGFRFQDSWWLRLCSCLCHGDEAQLRLVHAVLQQRRCHLPERVGRRTWAASQRERSCGLTHQCPSAVAASTAPASTHAPRRSSSCAHALLPAAEAPVRTVTPSRFTASGAAPASSSSSSTSQ